MPRSPHAVNAYRILARRRETLHPRVFLASQSVPGATAQHSPLGERPKNGASFDDAQHPRAASRSRAPPSRTARSIRFDSMCPCLIRDWLEAATEHLGKFSLSLFLSPGSSRPTGLPFPRPTLADLRRSILISTGCIEWTELQCTVASAYLSATLAVAHGRVSRCRRRLAGTRPWRPSDPPTDGQRAWRPAGWFRSCSNALDYPLEQTDRPSDSRWSEWCKGSPQARPGLGLGLGLGRAEGVAAAISACSKRIAHSRLSPRNPFARAPCSHRIASHRSRPVVRLSIGAQARW